MKKEFEMAQQEMNDIIAVNKNQNPVMKFGDYWSGMDLQEKINHYWEILGNKYGFKHLTVEESAKGGLFFLAEPKPIEIQKIQTEIENEGAMGTKSETSLIDLTPKLFTAVKMAQEALARWIISDSGISDADVLHELLGILDNEELVRAMKEVMKK